MRRRSNSHSPISLFTFLDTLVCTMGSLILMLLAMTPKIRERAEARELARLAALAPPAAVEPDLEPEPETPVVAAPPPVAPPVPDEDEEWRRAERQRRRDESNRSLADARQALKSKQAEYDRQRQLLKEAQEELKAVQDQILKARLKTESLTDESQSLTARETELEVQEAHIAQKIALTHKNLEMLNRQQATASNEFALVPYDGTSGTARRPIFIECSQRGFRFLPEEETLNPLDLQGFREDYNPLLTGAQVLLRYWTMHRRETGGSEPAPYVLLLVRPSGIENYGIARAFLSSLDANFGYELIEENWKLRVPDADPVAKNLLKQTLDMAVQAHRPSRDAIADLGLGGSVGGGRGSDRGGWADGLPPGGGSDDDAGSQKGSSSRGSRNPSVKFGPALRTPGGKAEFPQRGDRGGAGDADSDNAARSGGGGGTGLGSGTATSRGTGAGGTGASGTSIASRPAGISGGVRPGGPGSSDGSGNLTGAGTSPTGDPGVDDSALGNGSANGGRRAATGNRSGSGAAGAPSGKNGNGANDEADSGTAEDPSSATEETTEPGKPGGPTRGGKGGGNGAGSSGRPGGTGARPATLGGGGVGAGTRDGSGNTGESLELPPEYTPGKFPDGDGSGGNGEFPLRSMPDPRDAAGQSSSGGGAGSVRSRGASAARGSKTGSTSTSGADAGAGDTADSGNTLESDSASGTPSAGGSPLSKGQMGGPGVSLPLGLQGNRKSSAKEDDPDAGPRIPDDDAKTGGPRGRSNRPRLWGSARNKASIGLERKLQIRVHADRILIGSKDISVPVGNGETADEMIKQVVVGIDRAADRWGDPPTSYYWLPTLRFVIYPGGDRYYERLHGPLERNWGLPSTMEYAPVAGPAKGAAGARP